MMKGFVMGPLHVPNCSEHNDLQQWSQEPLAGVLLSQLKAIFIIGGKREQIPWIPSGSHRQYTSIGFGIEQGSHTQKADRIQNGVITVCGSVLFYSS